ncbi:MAG: helix-turn-helix domain-containing protein [Hyphomonadaceae bacterium]|nr:helix-turn-helix domain-containing protein [Hyphomonadaceae bacterium]
MSGVAKDDTNPNQPTDGSASAPDAGTIDTSAASVPPKDDAEARAARRNAPFLRVVTDNDPDFGAPNAVDAPHQRIGAIIRAARENAGYTLEQVSKETRVHLSHLRAIEEMTPNLLGAPVYAKGYIKSYARFLGMDEQITLDRYLSECAILKDPEKQDIAPPATSKARRLPVAVPMLGILIVGLVGAGAVFFLANGDKQPTVAADPAAAEAAATAAAATEAANAVSQRLRIVALRPGSVEVRSAKGDKYVHRDFVAGESYPVRVGAGWTVSVSDGSAFEWRLGDQSLGLLQPEGGQVYSQNVDLAAQRPPIVTEVPIDPSLAAEGVTAAAPPANGLALPATGANPAAPSKPRAPKPQSTVPPPREQPAAQAPVAPPPPKDPALAAYPDQ